jgi:hypothetical protein
VSWNVWGLTRKNRNFEYGSGIPDIVLGLQRRTARTSWLRSVAWTFSKKAEGVVECWVTTELAGRGGIRLSGTKESVIHMNPTLDVRADMLGVYST